MMRKAIALICAVAMSGLAMTGCSTSNGNEMGSESVKVEKQEVEKELSEEEQLFENLFSIDNFVQVKIDISDEELAKIEKDYDKYSHGGKSPIYRKADKVTFTIGDQVYELEEVGVRMKGNTSRRDFYDVNTNNMYDLIHLRLSFDETFDNTDYYGTEAKVWASEEERTARKERRFATLSGMEIKWNKNLDTTYARELYANTMFRDFGVMAQHQNMANIVLGGNNMGVYSIYEPVDKIFIKKYFSKEEKDGDLYKAAWTNGPASYASNVTYGTEVNENQKFNFTLKTNKKSSDHTLFRNLITTVNNSNLTKEEFEKVVDVDNWLTFCAVSYFVGNPDDLRNNYNNHYVYIKPDGKAYFIPYDNDRVFGVTVDWNPEGSGMTKVSPFSEKAEGANNFQFNPMIRNTIMTEKSLYYEEYKEKLAEVAGSKWLTEEYFETFYNKIKEHYESVVVPYKDFEHGKQSDFYFSLESTESKRWDGNLSMQQYLDRKLATYNDAVKNTDTN